MTKIPLAYGYFDSPVGHLLVAGDGEALHFVSFPSGSRTKQPKEDWKRDDTVFANVFEQLSAYFAKELTQFELAIHPKGTEFQNTVWATLLEIPYGRTWSYGQLAAKIERPTASRAVGAANGANPIPIIIPCHRVIGADKSLTGFGGGVEIKEFLLRHEGIIETQSTLF
ncbi:MAG: methylated-DNA--[protein]-cysteine S-methyltransferase [Hyphomicrobiales bacterium]